VEFPTEIFVSDYTDLESIKDFPPHMHCFVFISFNFISQNHRMLGVGRDLCGSSSPTPLPKQGKQHKLGASIYKIIPLQIKILLH